MNFDKKGEIYMGNINDLCKTLKKMTLEEFANILNSYNEENKIKEQIIENIQDNSKKIIYTIDELIEQYPFFTRYNLNKAIQNNGLPYFTIGNKKMFNKEEVEKWLEKESKVKKDKNKFEI